MKDMIYRQDAIEVIKGNSFAPGVDYMEINGYGAIEDIRALPSADRPQGEWICKGDWAECSLCSADSGTIMDGLERVPRYTRFCPNCGYQMRKE